MSHHLDARHNKEKKDLSLLPLHQNDIWLHVTFPVQQDIQQENVILSMANWFDGVEQLFFLNVICYYCFNLYYINIDHLKLLCVAFDNILKSLQNLQLYKTMTDWWWVLAITIIYSSHLIAHFRASYYIMMMDYEVKPFYLE